MYLKTKTRARLLDFALLVIVTGCPSVFAASAAPEQASSDDLIATAGFAGQPVAPQATLELLLNRSPSAAEGTLAVIIGQTDITGLMVLSNNRLSYTPRVLPLPTGETPVSLYLVSRSDEWKEIARFTLNVTSARQAGQTPVESRLAVTQTAKAGKYQITPTLNLGVKSQAAESHFPATSRPARPTFADATMQGSLQANLNDSRLNAQTRFDLVGSSFQNEALRFGQLGKAAPQIDLSNYLMRFQAGKTNVQVGNISYGTNRHLINGFSSRGISLSLPLGTHSDFSVAAVNGTSIAGWSNFFGLNRRRHQIVSGTLGFDLLRQERGKIRLEAGALYGSLLPLSGFSQGNITDAERSHGVSLRLVASDKSQRLRIDGALSRSQFTNPADPLLAQSTPLVAVRSTTRNARYLDASYDLLRNLKLGAERAANLTVTYRHERVDPLYRSVAAFAQADRSQNQVEVTGSIGQATAVYSNQRFDDNLDNLPTILKTRTRRETVMLGLPLASLITWRGNSSTTSMPPALSVWLPRISWSYDRVHQFARATPTNGGFRNASQVPDQVSINQNFNAEWMWQRWRMGYRFNRSFQDNRQPGRELADLRNLVNGLSLGVTPSGRLDLSFDLNVESARNQEVSRTTRLLRGAVNLNWRMTNKAALTAMFSTTFAGDVSGISRSRNAEADLQWSYGFGFGESGLRKVKGQFFIRYANRYARILDRVFSVNNLTTVQTLNTGLNFTFF